MNKNVIVHTGVLGMRWGRRKGSTSAATISTKKPEIISEDAKRIRDLKKKPVKELSNEDLKQIRDRDQLERLYTASNKSHMEKGTKILVGLGAFMGAAVTAYNNADSLIKIGKTLAKKKS